jgi:hypothetical protein
MVSQIEKYAKPAHSKDSPSTGAARRDTKTVTPTIAQVMQAILKTLPHSRLKQAPCAALMNFDTEQSRKVTAP